MGDFVCLWAGCWADVLWEDFVHLLLEFDVYFGDVKGLGGFVVENLVELALVLLDVVLDGGLNFKELMMPSLLFIWRADLLRI